MKPEIPIRPCYECGHDKKKFNFSNKLKITNSRDITLHAITFLFARLPCNFITCFSGVHLMAIPSPFKCVKWLLSEPKHF